MKSITPLDYYLEQQQAGLIEEDAQQLAVIKQFQVVHAELIKEYQTRRSLFGRWRGRKLIKGIYLWGGVGIGKTYMMDCFYHCLPFEQKTRMHFHQFMAFMHKELKKHQGEANPLEKIVRTIANSTVVLCLDEFIVKDIVDAMLLERLLDALFSHGICLITTSNTEPDLLYERGLQRQSFMPAISLLKQHTHVIHIQSEKDYRLSYLRSAGVYYTPDDAEATRHMEKTFELLSHHEPVETQDLIIHDRHIPVVKSSTNTVWFEFNIICRKPRSQHDYLVLSEQFENILISHVPVIPAQAKDTISLFIRMVDVFYDARIRLILSAEAPAEQLYTDGPYAKDYQRTQSRLLEMQSERWQRYDIINQGSKNRMLPDDKET